MHSVLLAGPSGSDPVGRRAVGDAVRAALPGCDIVDADRSGPPRRLLDAARRSAGLVAAGSCLSTSPAPSPDPAAAPSAPGDRSMSSLSGGPYRRSPLAGPASGRGPSVATMAVLSGAARRPLAVVGLTTGPLERRSARIMSRRVVRRPDLLLMGDEQSAGHLAAAGAPLPLRVAADPAWAVLAPPAAPAGAGDSVIVVLDGRVTPAVEDALAAGLEGLAQTGQPIRLMPWSASGTGDGAISWRLARRLRASVSARVEVETVPARLQEAAERMSGARLVVSLRYRALQAAAAAGVPAAGVAVEGRIAALAARMGQPVVRTDELAWSLAGVLERTPSGSAPAHLVAEEVARARAGLDLMRLVMEPSEVGADEVNCLPLVPVPWLS